MKMPFRRRKQTRKQRLAEAFVRMMENWSKQR
jgi:hypothetical protein